MDFTTHVRAAHRKLALISGLTCLLLATETFATWHEFDLAAHSTNAPCKICLSVSALSSANVGATPIVASPALPPQCETPPAMLPECRRTAPVRARGPPLAS